MSDAAIVLIVTEAGMARFAAAQVDDDIDLSISELAFTNQAFTPDPALTALPGEFRRIDTISGDVVGDDTVHLVVTDDGAVDYSARGFGLFLDDGTLFAVYGQPGNLLQKSAAITLITAIDIAFPVAGVDRITFGNANFLNPPATGTTRGVVELATPAEARAGTAGPLAISAETWAQLLATNANRGIVELATEAEAASGAEGPLVISAALWRLLSDTLRGDLVPVSRTIGAGGLIAGGGNLAANVALNVPRATSAAIRAGTDNDSAVTPAGFATMLGSLGSDVIVLPGRIIQIGTYRGTISGETTVPITFPVAFPNACRVVSLTSYLAAPSVVGNLWPELCGPATTTGMLVQLQSNDDGTRVIDGFDWIAFGS